MYERGILPTSVPDLPSGTAYLPETDMQTRLGNACWLELPANPRHTVVGCGHTSAVCRPIAERQPRSRHQRCGYVERDSLKPVSINRFINTTTKKETEEQVVVYCVYIKRCSQTKKNKAPNGLRVYFIHDTYKVIIISKSSYRQAATPQPRPTLLPYPTHQA